jgi:hypothetical protein
MWRRTELFGCCALCAVRCVLCAVCCALRARVCRGPPTYKNNVRVSKKQTVRGLKDKISAVIGKAVGEFRLRRSLAGPLIKHEAKTLDWNKLTGLLHCTALHCSSAQRIASLD